MTNAVAYLRCSTDEQADSGASLLAQEQTVRAECGRRGWHIKSLHRDALSGKNTARPGLTAALAALEQGDALIVAKLDRLTRSVVDLGRLLEHSRREGWALIALDLGVDTTTAAGELVANVMASVAQWERRAISERTKAGLAVRRAQGVRLGRERQIQPEVEARVAELLADGWTVRSVAEFANEAGWPAPGRGRWWPSTVGRIKQRTVTQ